jgi:AhpD family alkylhydroperoxidase
MTRMMPHGVRVPAVARISYVDPATAPPPVREALDALPPLNIFRACAHAETAFRPLLRLGGAILGQGELDARRRELAILRTAAVTGAEYEWVQHEAIALGVGATDAQIDAVRRGILDTEDLDEDDRIVLRCAEELLQGDGIREDTFAQARERLSERELVELILAVGYYRMLAGLMNSVAIDPDEPLGGAVVESVRRQAEAGSDG